MVQSQWSLHPHHWRDDFSAGDGRAECTFGLCHKLVYRQQCVALDETFGARGWMGGQAKVSLIQTRTEAGWAACGFGNKDDKQ